MSTINSPLENTNRSAVAIYFTSLYIHVGNKIGIGIFILSVTQVTNKLCPGREVLTSSLVLVRLWDIGPDRLELTILKLTGKISAVIHSLLFLDNSLFNIIMKNVSHFKDT